MFAVVGNRFANVVTRFSGNGDYVGCCCFE